LKKILILTSTYPRWRDDHEPAFVAELAARLADNYQVHVLAPHAPGAETHEQFGPVTVHRFRYAPQRLELLAYDGGITSNLKRHTWRYLLVMPFISAEFLAALRLVKQLDIDLLHAHWVIPQGVVAAALKQLLGAKPKLLVTAHGSDLTGLNQRALRAAKRRVLQECDALTVVSRSMAVLATDLDENCRPRVLPMGTDLSGQFVPDEKARQAANITFVGRLIPQKGVDFLLRAFPRVLESHPQARLNIIGHGPQESELQTLADQLGIASCVTFHGGIEHGALPGLLQAASLAVFPYCSTDGAGEEGFGLTLVEAMGCGCAVIASDQPAVREIIRHQETGLLVAQHDEVAIAESISALLHDDSLRQRLATAGRDLVKSRYDWQTISAGYARLIDDCIADRRSAN
jgi:glycosyltransferase involved in cell wall biosynthesis